MVTAKLIWLLCQTWNDYNLDQAAASRAEAGDCDFPGFSVDWLLQMMLSRYKDQFLLSTYQPGLIRQEKTWIVWWGWSIVNTALKASARWMQMINSHLFFAGKCRQKISNIFVQSVWMWFYYFDDLIVLNPIWCRAGNTIRPETRLSFQ